MVCKGGGIGGVLFDPHVGLVVDQTVEDVGRVEQDIAIAVNDDLGIG